MLGSWRNWFEHHVTQGLTCASVSPSELTTRGISQSLHTHTHTHTHTYTRIIYSDGQMWRKKRIYLYQLLVFRLANGHLAAWFCSFSEISVVVCPSSEGSPFGVIYIYINRDLVLERLVTLSKVCLRSKIRLLWVDLQATLDRKWSSWIDASQRSRYIYY